MKNSKCRNIYLDFIKGFAIFLVVLGHCIQYGSGNIFLESTQYFHNVIFRMIYSFHMPLFMLISGYLFYRSAQKDLKTVLINKIFTILLPLFCWSVVNFIVDIYNKNILLDQGLIYLLKKYIWCFLGTLWFLWAILMCTVVVLIIKKFLKDKIFVYMLIPILFFVTPDRFNLGNFKFMYPYFVAGYLFYKYKDSGIINKTISFINRKKIICLCSVGLIYTIFFFFFKKDQFIYTTGVTILGTENYLQQILNDLIRWGIGFVGSVFVLILFNRIKTNIFTSVVAKLGQISLGIYILNGYVNLYVLKVLTSAFQFNILFVSIETIVVMIICYIGTIFFSKNRVLNRLFFGGR